MKRIDIVVPCYNEQEVLPLFKEETDRYINELTEYEFNYIFVDDGSKDNTLSILKEFASEYSNVKYISFSRNFGKESAMYAGFSNSTGDYVIIMDADLQHPPKLIPDMIKEVENGYDCCALYRSQQKGESIIRKLVSKMFFSFQNKISTVKMPNGAVDYRIMSRKMVDTLVRISEKQRFSKGLFCWIGFNTKWLEYDNVERPAGTTKWNIWKLFKYALDGFTSFSVSPLRFIFLLGAILSCISFIYLIVLLILFLCKVGITFNLVLVGIILLATGIIEISIGIVAEYIGRILTEVKNRPVYVIADTNINSFKE